MGSGGKKVDFRFIHLGFKMYELEICGMHSILWILCCNKMEHKLISPQFLQCHFLWFLFFNKNK